MAQVSFTRGSSIRCHFWRWWLKYSFAQVAQILVSTWLRFSLTFTTGYNSALSNKSFSEKRDRKDNAGKYIGYRNGLNLNADVADKDIWTIDIINERTEKLVQEILSFFAI